VAAPALAGTLATIMGSGLLLGLLVILPQLRKQADTRAMAAANNPTELKTALAFALVYSIVLLASSWLSQIAGNSGLYVVALLSGATDVDAITLSSLRMFNQQRLLSDVALSAITLAVLANTLFKLGMAYSIGGAAFGKRLLWPMLAAGLGCILALLILTG